LLLDMILALSSALRNEDFEVWLFRLLLEYGRVIDEAMRLTERGRIAYIGESCLVVHKSQFGQGVCCHVIHELRFIQATGRTIRRTRES
jgi:hypothetical protein